MNEFAIHDAAGDGDLEKVRQLIEAGVPVDNLNEEGQTPLHRAAFYGQYEVAGLLISSECDLDIKDHRGFTPVMLAAYWGKKAIVDLLLHRGAQVNNADNKGLTLLHIASTLPYWTGIVRLILDNGEADLNAVNRDGYTPLMMAGRRGNEEVTSLLVRAGADVTRGDVKKGSTVLHRAAERFRTRVIQVLGKEGLDLSPQDVNGDTPLHIACQSYVREDRLNNRQETIKQFLDAGADTNVKNNKGRTALNIGIWRGILTHELIRLFVQKGAVLEKCDCKHLSRNPLLKENVLKDVELCTQSVVNKFNRQSLPALNNIPYFTRRLPNIDNFKLGPRQIDQVENLVRCEIERNTFCNVFKVRPISLGALCVLSLITCQSGKKRAASTGFSHSQFKRNRN